MSPLSCWPRKSSSFDCKTGVGKFLYRIRLSLDPSFDRNFLIFQSLRDDGRPHFYFTVFM